MLIVPGDHFGMDGYLRLGFGEPPEYNRAGLDRLQRPAGVAAHRARAPVAPARMNAARAVAGPDRVRQRRAALRQAARRDRGSPRLHVEGRRHLDAPSRQRRRHRRHRHAPRASPPSKASQSLDRLDPAPRERSGIDVIRQVARRAGRRSGGGPAGAASRPRCSTSIAASRRRRTCAPRSKARRTSSPPTRARRRSRTTSSRRWPNPSIACSSSKAR